MNKRWNKLCVAALACVALVVPLTACEGQLPTRVLIPPPRLRRI